MATELLIGELANQFGLSSQAIRYYERLGLIDEPKRSKSGYRLYSDKTCERLKFIRSAQGFSLSLQEIKELLELESDSLECQSLFAQKVQNHLQAMEQQLQEIKNSHQLLSRQCEQLQFLNYEESLNSDIDTNKSLQKLMDKITGNLEGAACQPSQDPGRELMELYTAGERDFQGMKLVGAKLNGTILSWANFSRAELMLASLNEVSMEKTILNRAFLSGADMIGACLTQAELNGATIIGADLSEADLSGASLASSNLGGACLYEADLQNANLSEAVLIGVDLRGANLKGANLLGCNLFEAKLDDTQGDLYEMTGSPYMAN